MKNKQPILVSACLLGINCNYEGGHNLNQKVLDFIKDKDFIPVCPELFGGFAIPRPDSEIIGGQGEKVLKEEVKVVEPDGNDVTDMFIRGAKEVLKIAELAGTKSAILKARSPSCGAGKIYDGTFNKTLVSGDGVLTSILQQNGIEVTSDEDL